MDRYIPAHNVLNTLVSCTHPAWCVWSSPMAYRGSGNRVSRSTSVLNGALAGMLTKCICYLFDAMMQLVHIFISVSVTLTIRFYWSSMFPKSNGTLVGMFIDGYVIGVNVILSNECARDNSLISSTRRKESAREWFWAQWWAFLRKYPLMSMFITVHVLFVRNF